MEKSSKNKIRLSMEVKHFNYEEFTKVKTKSLNCDSCGGGLKINVSNGKTCNCEYCGNTNMILEDGKTKVVEKVVSKPVQKEEIEPISSGMSKTAMMAIAIFGVVAVGAFAYYYISKKRKEKEKRKRILLINH